MILTFNTATVSEEGKTPLELAENAVGIKLHYNGTKIAPWWSSLGFLKAGSFSVSASSIQAGGGIIPRVRLRYRKKKIHFV
jgi:hypothetical protein